MQKAMRKAEATGNTDCPVKIKLVAPPLYVLTTQTLDKVSLRFNCLTYQKLCTYQKIDVAMFSFTALFSRYSL